MQLEALQKNWDVSNKSSMMQVESKHTDSTNNATSIAGGITSRPTRYRWSGGATAQHLLPMDHKVSYIPIFYKRYSKVRAWYSPIQWLETHCW